MYKKIVKEHLFEFKKGLDPIDSLGLGRRKLIEEWLEHFHIDFYVINDDYTIDVNTDVLLNRLNLTNFPDFIQFNHIKGFFDISNNKFTSLRGCPKTISETFYCSGNNIKDLSYFPETIGKKIFIYDNPITSLKGVQKNIKDDFSCSGCKLTTLKYGPTYVAGTYYAYDNPLQDLIGLPRIILGSLDISSCKLNSLYGISEIIHGNLDVSYNNLDSLEYAPKQIDGYIKIKDNNKKFTRDEIQKHIKIRYTSIEV